MALVPDSVSSRPTSTSSRYAWYVLGLFCAVYVMNFLDRTLMFILFPPIKRELVFTDVQLALLGSTSFAIFYTALGIPFGRLADRSVRKNMIAAGLAVWSVFSGLTGFAQDFWTMFGCRVMVGIGEATLGPAALSMLSDYFPLEKRATAQSIYSAGIPLGAAVAFFLGGSLSDSLGWRTTFFLLSFPGLLLAVLVWFVQEPVRGITETSEAARTQMQTATPDWRILVRTRALYFHTFGYACAAIASNSLSLWMPSFFNRAFGVALKDFGVMAGVSSLVAGGLATGFGGAIADRFRARSRGGRMQFTALAVLCCAPLWAALLLSGVMPVMIACFFLLSGLNLIWLGPAAADMHDVVGPKLRGLGVGVYFFVVGIIGYGIVPPIIGKLSDALGSAHDPLQMRYAFLVFPISCALGAVLLWLGNRELRKHKA